MKKHWKFTERIGVRLKSNKNTTKTKDDLAIAYTPGVAKVSEVIGKNNKNLMN